MQPGLTSALFVAGLMRAAQGAGGTATQLARGDANVGAVLLVCRGVDGKTALLERAIDTDQSYFWHEVIPENDGNQPNIDEYVINRRRFDTDLWVIELTIADAKRFAADYLRNA